MEGIYQVSSADRVRNLEEELSKELKELKNEIEDGDFLAAGGPPKTFRYSCI